MQSDTREYENPTTAVVLAGGRSIRMRPLGAGGPADEPGPKSLVNIGGKALIFWVLRWLKSQSISNVVLGLAWRKDQVMRYLAESADVKSLKLNLKVSNHKEEDETGGAFRTAIDTLKTDDEDIVAMYGDELIKIDLEKVWKFHQQRQPAATIVVTPMISPYGHIDLDQDGVSIIEFREKPLLATTLVSTGVFILNRTRVYPFLPASTEPMETTTFRLLARERQLAAYKLQINDDWTTIDTPKDVSRAEAKLRSWGWIGE